MPNKKIVIASDSFKGTLSSMDICSLFKNEIDKRDDLSLVTVPIADGGEGSLDCISSIKPGRYVEVEVTNLYFNKVKTKFFVDNDNNAYIEVASCAGYNLKKKDNDPGLVTTFGLGEQIKKAIELGIKNIYIFMGGSASNDGGVGLASALGTKFYDKNNKGFIPVGLTLTEIDRIDSSETQKLLKGINIIALSDVKSPFYGEEGAAYKFGPQKGASKDEVILLDQGLRHLSKKVKQSLNIDISDIPGSGAAGGLGGGLLAFANAKIVSGIDTILDLISFDEIIKDADIVVSGEGKLDKQTFDGKVIDGISKHCLKMNKPLYLIVGISEAFIDDIKRAYPCIKGVFETNYKHLPFEEVKNRAREDYLAQIERLLNKF